MDDGSSETCLDWFNNMNFKNFVWFIKAISYFVLLRSLGIIINTIIIIIIIIIIIKFCSISIIMLTAETCPCFKNFNHVKSQLRVNKQYFPLNIPILIIQFSLYYLSSGRLQEVEKQNKISNF